MTEEVTEKVTEKRMGLYLRGRVSVGGPHKSNVVIDVGREAMADLIIGQTGAAPTYVAVGTQLSGLSVADQRAMTELVDELWRAEVTTRNRIGTIAQLRAPFGPGCATGTWKELALFDSAHRQVALAPCDVIGSWTSDNTLSVEYTDYKEGFGALESQGALEVSFANTSLSPAYGGLTFSEADKLQLWYYVADKSLLSGALKVVISSSAALGTNEYTFEFVLSSLANGWNWLSRNLSDYQSKIGSPNLNVLCRARISAVKGGVVLERIDKIRLWGAKGRMWTRAELIPSVEKTVDTLRNVDWELEVVTC